MKNSMIISGHLIVACEPFAFTLQCDQRSKRCDFCFKRLSDAAVHCDACRYVIYCNTRCELKGQRMHRNECPVLAVRPLRAITRLMTRIIVRREAEPNYSEEVGSYQRTWNDLMDHYDDVIRDNDAMYAFNEIYNELEMVFKRELFDVNELIKIYGKVLVNSFAIQDELLQPIGRAVYLGASIFDHSCVPQAVFTFIGTTIFVKAIKDIPTNDYRSIRICYINEMETTKDRQNDLQTNYYFKCDCERCRKEEYFLYEINELRTICDHLEKLSLDPISAMQRRTELENSRHRFVNSSKFDFQSFVKRFDINERQLAVNAMNAIERERNNLIACRNVLSVRICDLLSIIEDDFELSLRVIEIYREYYGQLHPRLALKLYQTAITGNTHKYSLIRRKLLIEARNIALTILPTPRQLSIKVNSNESSIDGIRRRSRPRAECINNVTPANIATFPTLLSLIEKEFTLFENVVRFRANNVNVNANQHKRASHSLTREPVYCGQRSHLTPRTIFSMVHHKIRAQQRCLRTSAGHTARYNQLYA